MKIFCIGFQKTGTSTMGVALKGLGFSVTGAHGTRDPDIARTVYELVDRLVPLHDAFQDNPWPVMYQYLDRNYPGSKFILTIRDPDSWLSSIVDHCGRRCTPMRAWIYGFGNPRGHETEYRSRFVQHYEEVRAYFSGREGNDYLEMDLQAGDGWDKLCSFLGISQPPASPFPHRNRGRDRSGRRRLVLEARGVLDNLRRGLKS